MRLSCVVLSALVEEKVYPDPYTGMNLRSIPGTTYPIFEDFSNIPMPPKQPLRMETVFRELDWPNPLSLGDSST
jgi:exo-1,4-beta-D-glucosaminidase